MEDNLLPETPTFKLYRDNSVYTSTFLGGPLAAGYLAAQNYKQLGQEKNARITWIIAAISTILIFGGVFLIPEVQNIPNSIIPVIYTVVAQALVKHFQGKDIKTHIEQGGKTHSIWRTILIGLIGLTITVSILIVILFLSSQAFGV